jgi:hypothetical protein
LNAQLSFLWSANCGSIDGEYGVEWYSPRVGSDGLVYVGSDSNTSTVYSFNVFGTLEWAWTAPTPSHVLSPVFGPTGQLYVASNTVNLTTPATLANAGSLVSLSSSGAVVWTYKFLGPSTSDVKNWIYAAIDGNKIYITNIVDSNLVILKDLGRTFQNYKEIIAGDGDSGIYGSNCLSGPVVGSDGVVFWCNGNEVLPGIFGAGYPTVTTVF